MEDTARCFRPTPDPAPYLDNLAKGRMTRPWSKRDPQFPLKPPTSHLLLLCFLRGMRLAVFVCLFVVVGWFSFFFFFFFEVQRNEERGEKVFPLVSTRNKVPRKSLYGSLSTGIGSERQNNNFLPFSLILHTRKKNSWKLTLQRMRRGLGGGGSCPRCRSDF